MITTTEAVDANLARSPAGPVVTHEMIEAKIADETYWIPSVSPTTTVCALALKNGFTVIGKSGCADPANFNAELGQKIARDDAVRQIWQLEGYLLKEQLHQEAQAKAP